MKIKKPKLKTCKVKACGAKFEPFSPMQIVCGPTCAAKYAADKRERAERLAKIAERRKDRAKLDSYKSIRKLIAEAQTAFNAFIRLRDADKNCISCGRPWPIEWGKGGRFDAGHYRSAGSADHLRFHEMNCHGQCKQCNGPNGQGRHIDYRLGLIDRYGINVVEQLEADNAVRKWTREEVIRIKKYYQAKVIELRKTMRKP